ncbi:MSHA biogenesis protein MshP [Vibrio sp. ES.051]|uniref:MSHA biogenesis protein MshP n=1 Tax=Vibrio sp. ES.051 TaxID=1761909 RepID=UPI000BF27134|nr:MSHA biogenesis protein MshP [Vibrio sp. ES.051]PFG55207.1 MSHA biogenesis protein MshP [Vibrio sp. ES.051]
MFHNQQKGNVLIVTLFVIIVMGYLAASLMKVTWSNQSGLTREFLGTKAWFTAQSSNDWVLTQFFPLGKSVAVATRCDDIEAESVKPDSRLFDKACKIKATECQKAGKLPGEITGEEVELYVVKSVAVCGSGQSQVQRQQEIWIKD